jgi:2-iminobutanoate/2-iminopropanoate deaminase
MKKEIFAEKGAPPKGPYSQAIVADGPMVFISGQGPVDPATGELCLGTFRQQAELVFQNIATLLEAAGASWANVVKVSVFLADLGDFAKMNEIYQAHLSLPYPARTTVQAGLPPRMLIEVDCIAIVPSP